MVYYLATPKDALRIFEAIVSFLEGTYQSWVDLTERLIVPFVYEVGCRLFQVTGNPL
jgi:hypothetical protein